MTKQPPGVGIPNFALLITVIFVSVISGSTQTSHRPPAVSHSRRTSRIYEDSEVKLLIPEGWRLVPSSEIRINGGDGLSLGNSVRGPLILRKDHYLLAIAYNTGQASGIAGGRFIEIFSIPWPGVEDQWECSGYFGRYTQPASRILTFTNVTVDTGDPKVQELCGIKKSLGRWTRTNSGPSFEGDRRWFGGYFTDAEGGYFFDPDSNGCGEKAYTLTFQAESPDKLPIVGDQTLKRTIQQAIDIVDSIHYKQCAPAKL